MGITAFVIYKISTLSLIRTFELDYLMKSGEPGVWESKHMVFPACSGAAKRDILMNQNKNRRWIRQQMLQQLRVLLEDLEQCSRRLSQSFVSARFKCGQSMCFTAREG
jgi:hypothetical protein